MKIKKEKNKNANFIYIALIIAFVVVTILTVFPIFMSPNNNVINPFEEEMAQYDTNPPTSGEHDEQFFPEKIVYSEPLAPEFQVHILDPHEISKAHLPVQNSGREGRDLVKAGILLQYNCDCPDIVKKLTAIALDYRPRVVVAPWPYMEEKIAITARNRLEKSNGVDEIKIRNFIEEAFRNYDSYLECLEGDDKIFCANQAGYI